METGPIIVAGMGGSGSRVVARILMALGVEMPENRNVPQEDALDVALFDYRWAPLMLRGVADHKVMRIAFDRTIRPLLPQSEPWGWKHSPSVHLLPFYAERFPDLRFIHIIRDGRDMVLATSGGVTHTKRLGPALLDGDPTPVTPDRPAWKGLVLTREGGPEATPPRLAAVWARINREAREFAERHMSKRYLLVRLEDLTSRPDETVQRLARFVDLPANVDVAQIVTSPASVGRWREHDVTALVPLMRRELELFGYTREFIAPMPELEAAP